MTHEARIKLTVLFQDELRIAAAALDRLRVLLSSETASDGERDAACTAALSASMAALAGAEDRDAVLVLANKSDLLGSQGRSAGGEMLT